MTDLRTAAQRALAALENASDIMDSWAQKRQDDAITALRAALAEPLTEPLPFGIEVRAGVPVLYCNDGSCRPATAEELMMWRQMSRAHGITE